MKDNKALAKITSKLAVVGKFLIRYGIFICLVLIGLMFSALIWRIGMLAQAEPSEDDLSNASSEVSRPKIDQSAVKSIQQLQAQNVDVQTLFPVDRNNPFQE